MSLDLQAIRLAGPTSEERALFREVGPGRLFAFVPIGTLPGLDSNVTIVRVGFTKSNGLLSDKFTGFMRPKKVLLDLANVLFPREYCSDLISMLRGHDPYTTTGEVPRRFKLFEDFTEVHQLGDKFFSTTFESARLETIFTELARSFSEIQARAIDKAAREAREAREAARAPLEMTAVTPAQAAAYLCGVSL